MNKIEHSLPKEVTIMLNTLCDAFCSPDETRSHPASQRVWRDEVARILRELANRVQDGEHLDGTELLDLHGEVVGDVIFDARYKRAPGR